MSGFDVTPWALDGAAVELSETGIALRSSLTALSAIVAELAWSGAAASSFAQAWDEWGCAAGDVIGALETMAGLLRADGRTYATAEAANVL